MLKTRTLIRLGAGLVVLLFILWAIVIIWPESPPRPEEIAKRGLKPPPGMKIRKANAGDPSLASIGGPRDWVDQGFDALAGWHNNPFGIKRGDFLEHVWAMRFSKDTKDQEEYRRLLALAKIWQDNLLTRYPELKVQYRNIPDERNALKRLAELAKRLHADNTSMDLPDDLIDRMFNKKPWDAAAARTWLDANRDTLDEFRAICRMPESSVKDLDTHCFYSLFSGGPRALLLEARLAVDCGDIATAQESVRTALRLSDLLLGSEAPSFSEFMTGGSIRNITGNYVVESLLPAIPDSQANPAAWESVLKPATQTPSDYSRIMRGQWNRMMQFDLLPALVDPAANRPPADAEVFVETLTNYYSDSVLTNNSLHLAELPSHPNPVYDTSDLSWRSQQISGSQYDYSHYRSLWESRQILTGRIQAAFAILKGQPVPNDPIYGKPYQWNPETRQLELPKGPEFSKIRPLTLPKR